MGQEPKGTELMGNFIILEATTTGSKAYGANLPKMSENLSTLSVDFPTQWGHLTSLVYTWVRPCLRIKKKKSLFPFASFMNYE